MEGKRRAAGHRMNTKKEPSAKRACVTLKGSLEEDIALYQWLLVPLALTSFETDFLDQQLLCTTRCESSYFQREWEIDKLDPFLQEQEYLWGRHGTVFDISSPSSTATVDQLSCQRLTLSSIVRAVESLNFGYGSLPNIFHHWLTLLLLGCQSVKLHIFPPTWQRLAKGMDRLWPGLGGARLVGVFLPPGGNWARIACEFPHSFLLQLRGNIELRLPTETVQVCQGETAYIPSGASAISVHCDQSDWTFSLFIEGTSPPSW